MTPTQIATQAAEALLRQEYESVSGVFGEAYGPHPHDIERVSRLILSAAAKMVRESGAVEALEDAQSDIPAIKERTGWKFAGREMAYAKALAYLRSLSEQEKTQ